MGYSTHSAPGTCRSLQPSRAQQNGKAKGLTTRELRKSFKPSMFKPIGYDEVIDKRGERPNFC